ncbi:MAG: glycosyltransferase family 2 protein [Candidatus Omnitrophica bacterium]|nr:glycosyltransferase family 2 protein [Candidatus Omnitrophota bacterium]
MKAISIVIVTSNSSKYIESCLDSILMQDFKDYEIIVVDNGSKDSTIPIIKNRYASVKLICNLKNFGPCCARNQGINNSSGKFVLCLDYDVKILDNFLTNIYKAIEKRDKVGAIGPKILMSNGKTIYSAGIHFSYLWKFYDIGDAKIDTAAFGLKKNVEGVSAAAVIYKREALETIKQDGEYFDEDFFYLFEDVDISWRLRKKNWEITYTPDAVCLHVSGRSRNKDKYSQYLSMRNRYLAIIKNESLSSLPRLFVVFFIYDLWRNMFMLVTNAGYFLRAWYEILGLFKKMLKKRCKP